MADSEIPEDRIRDFFDSLDNWVILKNPDLIGNLMRGGDCDIAVREEARARKSMESLLGPPTFICDRGYVVGFFYPWGSIDIVRDFSWKGILLMTGQEIIADSEIGPSGWPVVRRDKGVCIELLSSLIWGGFIKGRYWDEIIESWDSDRAGIGDCLVRMVGGDASAPIVQRLNSRDSEGLVADLPRLRWALAVHHFRSRFKRTLAGTVASGICELKLIMVPPSPVACVVGGEFDEVKELLEVTGPGLRRIPGVPRLENVAAGWPGIAMVRMILRLLGLARFRSKCGFVVFHVQWLSKWVRWLIVNVLGFRIVDFSPSRRDLNAGICDRASRAPIDRWRNPSSD